MSFSVESHFLDFALHCYRFKFCNFNAATKLVGDINTFMTQQYNFIMTRTVILRDDNDNNEL